MGSNRKKRGKKDPRCEQVSGMIRKLRNHDLSSSKVARCLGSMVAIECRAPGLLKKVAEEVGSVPDHVMSVVERAIEQAENNSVTAR